MSKTVADTEQIANNRIILIDRESGADVAVIHPSAEAAVEALDGSLLIDDLVSEDCMECWIPIDGLAVDLTKREVIFV